MLNFKIAGFKQNDVFEPIICREPSYCTEDIQPKPPVESGLEPSNSTPSIGVPQFSYLSFNCKESDYVMYKPPLFIEKFPDDYKFEVTYIRIFIMIFFHSYFLFVTLVIILLSFQN